MAKKKRKKRKWMAKEYEGIIKDPKLRGEWAESVFVARANEEGLAVSRPWGDSKSFDFVVGKPGRFVGVQVKSTVFESGGGYSCAVKHNNQTYAKGSFDFVAAYVIPEDVWYIVPAEKMEGRETMIICSDSGQALYEEYREAWKLLREAPSGEIVSQEAEQARTESAEGEGKCGVAGEAEKGPAGDVLGRMQATEKFVRNFFERRARGRKR